MVTRLRWSNNKETWEFMADLASEAGLREPALDALATARLGSRRRIHDGKTTRNYHWYDALHLDMEQREGSTAWTTVLWVPAMRIWEDVPGWMQQPPYDTAAWYRQVLRMRDYLADLDALCDQAVSVITDINRRPAEWAE